MGSRALKAFCLDWHIDQSPAMHELLVDALAAFCKIELVPWDGMSFSAESLTDSSPVIFCQLPPPPSVLANSRLRVLWLPMWDHARIYDLDWWRSLPPTLRVVAFSEPVAACARTANLDVLRLRFHKNPATLPPATWAEGRVLYYWNRTGMVGPRFLRKLCDIIGASELIFRPQIDPRITPSAFYELPERLGQTRVTVVTASSAEGYRRSTLRANVFLAPRTVEGVGLAFLEAMARGNAVIAYDAPTMNEYIEDGVNGLLLRDGPPPRRAMRAFSMLTGRAPGRPSYQLSVSQNWEAFATADLEALGGRARADQGEGYTEWKQSIRSYSDFLQGW